MTLRLQESIEQKNFLITQSPVLNLLHAHGESPMERCSSWLNPFANRTRFTPSVRKFASHLVTLKNVGWGSNNIRRVCKAERAHRNVDKSLQTVLTSLTILTPFTFAACEHASFASSNVAETRMNTEFCGGGGAKL